MSYEGYDQYLCGNGHYWIQDCNNDNEECPVCKGKFVWRNGVNETNFDGWGYIDMEMLLVLLVTMKAKTLLPFIAFLLKMKLMMLRLVGMKTVILFLAVRS